MTFMAVVRAGIALGLALLLVCFSGCSSSNQPASTSTRSPAEGTVTGTVRVVGGPVQGSNNSAGQVYVFTSASLAGTPLAKVSTARGGSFTLTLSPGTYYLAATSPSFNIDPPPAIPPCHANGPVVVSPGASSKVDIFCAMK